MTLSLDRSADARPLSTEERECVARNCERSPQEWIAAATAAHWYRRFEATIRESESRLAALTEERDRLERAHAERLRMEEHIDALDEVLTMRPEYWGDETVALLADVRDALRAALRPSPPEGSGDAATGDDGETRPLADLWRDAERIDQMARLGLTVEPYRGDGSWIAYRHGISDSDAIADSRSSDPRTAIDKAVRDAAQRPAGGEP